MPDIALVSPHLAIGCFASICRDRLGDRLVDFSGRFPEVVIGLHEMPRAALIHALGEGEVALAIVPGDPGGEFEAVPLWSEQIVVALPATHPLATAPSINPARLAGELFLVSRVEHGWDMHRFLAARALPAGVPIALQDVEERRLFAMIGEGRGCALLCRSHVPAEPPSVAIRPLEGEAGRFTVHAIWRRGSADGMRAALLAAIEPDPVS